MRRDLGAGEWRSERISRRRVRPRTGPRPPAPSILGFTPNRRHENPKPNGGATGVFLHGSHPVDAMSQDVGSVGVVDCAREVVRRPGAPGRSRPLLVRHALKGGRGRADREAVLVESEIPLCTSRTDRDTSRQLELRQRPGASHPKWVGCRTGAPMRRPPIAFARTTMGHTCRAAGNARRYARCGCRCTNAPPGRRPEHFRSTCARPHGPAPVLRGVASKPRVQRIVSIRFTQGSRARSMGANRARLDSPS